MATTKAARRGKPTHRAPLASSARRARRSTRGQGHRADAFADDLVLPRMLHCKLLRSPHRPRAHPVASTPRAAAGAAGRVRGAHRRATCRSRSASCRSPRTSTRSAPTGCASSATRSRRSRPSTRRRRSRPLRPDRRRLRAAADRSARSRRRSRTREPRSTTTATRATSTSWCRWSSATSRRASREADRVCEDVFFYEGNTHLPMEQHAAVAHCDADGKLTLWSSTQTPHYLHRALAKVLEHAAGAHPRHRHARTAAASAARAIRSTTRSSWRKLALITGRPGEDLPHPRGGLLLPPRPAPGADVDQDRRHEGRRDHRHALRRRCLDGGAYGSYGVASTYYTGALQTVTYQVPRYRFDGARVFTNKPPCGPKRGHGTPQPRFALEVQLDKIAERARPRPGRAAAAAPRPSRTRVTANCLQRRHRSGLGDCIDKVVEASGWKEQLRQAAAAGRGLGLACSSYLMRRGPADLLERHAALGRAAEARPRRRRHRLLRRDRDRPGLRLGPRLRRRRGPRHRAVRHPRRHRRHRPHAGRPRLLLLARHADDGQRRASRRPSARASCSSRRRRAKLEVPPERAGVRRAAASSTSQDPARGRDASREAVVARRGEVRHARHGRLLHAAAARRAATRARGVGPVAGATPTRPRSSRWRSTGDRHRARCRRSGSRTTSAVRSTRCSSMGQVEGSVYMGLGEALMEEMAFRATPTATSSTSSRRCSSTRARRRSRCREVDTYPGRGPRPQRPVRRQGGRAGPAAADHAGRRQRGLRRASACASTRCRSRRRRC